MSMMIFIENRGAKVEHSSEDTQNSRAGRRQVLQDQLRNHQVQECQVMLALTPLYV